MKPRLTPLVGLIVIAATATTGCQCYHKEESGLGDGVTVIAYYRCQDLSCRYVEPARTRVDVVVRGRRYRFDKGANEVSQVYIGCGRVFLQISNGYGEYLALLCREGELVYVWDLSEVKFDLKESFSCRTEGDSLLLEFTVLRADDTGETRQTMSRRLTNLGAKAACLVP